MSVFDQLDTEPLFSYISSSTDVVMFGDRLVNLPGPTPEADPRFLIGGRIAGTNNKYLTGGEEQVVVPYWLWYELRGTSYFGRPKRSVTISDQEEFLEDSFVPHPIDIHEKNLSLKNPEGILTLQVFQGPTTEIANTTPYHGERYGIFPYPPNEFGFSSICPFLRTRAANPQPPSDNEDIHWVTHHPFQTEYKNMLRSLRGDARFAVEKEIPNGQNQSPLPVPSSSNLISTIDLLQVGYLISLVTSNTASLGFRKDERGSISWNDLAKTFFGTGDSQRITPNYRNLPSFHFVETITDAFEITFLTAPIIRGYRYGIKNVFPEQLGARWRTNRYGQFRDMLEQRPGYTTIDRATGKRINTPVEVRPVSDDLKSKFQTYLETDEPVSFNPHDSGIFDKFCRSGQPFPDP